MTPTGMFGHERLHVYAKAVAFMAQVEELTARLPRPRHYISDQLRRASTSICTNIAEGAGEFSPREKARLYRIALRSAAECAALLDAAELVGALGADTKAPMRTLSHDIMSMLTRLVRARVADARNPERGPNRPLPLPLP